MARHTTVPTWLPPQLATLAAAAPPGPDWVHEIKYDGYRLIAWVDRDEVRLLTRNQKDWTDRFPAVAAGLARLGIRNAILDGEVAVELADGTTSFQSLQNAIREPDQGQLLFWVFDLLFLDGEDLRRRPLLERKAELSRLLEGAGGVLRYSDHVSGHGPDFHAQACRHRLEGIISKRATAPYRGGRGADWLKVKCLREQEFVVGGYTEPSGSREGLGALHIGAFDDDGQLVYHGKVGTGFTEATLKQLQQRLAPLQQRDSPFVGGPKGAAARASHWVEPRLVVQIRFTEITGDGRLRHPAFTGLRDDKDAADVRLETALPAAAGSATAGAGSAKSAGSANSEGRVTSAAPARAAAAGQGDGPGTARRADSADRAEKAGSAKGAAAGQVAGVRLTNPDKVLYPETGVTKSELARYYEAVADWMLPHISARPLTLVRCPSGHDGQCFFQKHFDERSVPAALRLVEVEERDGPELYGMLGSAAGMISLVQLGALELHTWNSRSDKLERPDRFIIDLDPDPGVTWDDVVDAALNVRHLLEELGLESFLKTTGGKGLHVVVPLVRRADWDEVKAFSGAVASLLVRVAPERYTTEMSKKKRHGRILLDYLRNARGATAIEAYSTRAKPGAPVAAPIHWDELADGVRSDSFNVRNMAERLKQLGRDPWKDIGAVRQSLTAPMKRRLGL